MNPDQNEFEAACHCGSVKFTVTLVNGLKTARRCNCSFCRMRGAVAVSAPLSGIHFLTGEELLTLYQFNTRSAKHYFFRVAVFIPITNDARARMNMG